MMKDSTYNIWLEKRISSAQVREYLEEIYKIPVALLTENYELESKQGANPTAGFQISYPQGIFKTEIYIWNPPEGLSQNRIEEIRLAQQMSKHFSCKAMVDGSGYQDYDQVGFDATLKSPYYSLIITADKVTLVSDAEFELDDPKSKYEIVKDLDIV
jgi:hypothetical protein